MYIVRSYATQHQAQRSGFFNRSQKLSAWSRASSASSAKERTGRTTTCSAGRTASRSAATCRKTRSRRLRRTPRITARFRRWWTSTRRRSSRGRGRNGWGVKKKDETPSSGFRTKNSRQLMDQFLSQPVTGQSVLEIEGLIRTALVPKGADIVGYLLQTAADQIDAAYQPQAGENVQRARSHRVSMPLRHLHPATRLLL